MSPISLELKHRQPEHVQLTRWVGRLRLPKLVDGGRRIVAHRVVEPTNPHHNYRSVEVDTCHPLLGSRKKD